MSVDSSTTPETTETASSNSMSLFPAACTSVQPKPL